MIDLFMNANDSHKNPFFALLCVVLLLPAGLLADEAHEEAETLPPSAVESPDTPGNDDSDTARQTATRITIEERVQVVGTPLRAHRATGSVDVIDTEELERHAQTDVQRILRRVPGVNIQDEEGYGLRPSIGFRGTGVERSSKITLLEDGVPIAPAPYSAPSAYYFPTAARMEAIEVSKGPASIRQGPHTTGGVLNLVSRSIPTEFGGRVRLSAGEDAQRRTSAMIGDSRDRFGWLIESFTQETDGFKRLDSRGTTGFDLQDLVGKFRYNSGPNAAIYQSFELKLGDTEQNGDETYLGLTADDFRLQPYRRYAASGEDFIITEHEQIQIQHFVVPAAHVDVTTTLYYNNFFRNWHKLESIAGARVSDVLAAPDAPEFSGLMDVIRGDVDSAPGLLNVRNNRRDYYSRGIQSVVGLKYGSGASEHRIEIGVRIHEDEEDRFQEEDLFEMVGGAMQLTALGAPGSQSNRISSAEAIALFARDVIQWGRWRFEPGLRFESVDFTRVDYGTADPERSGVTKVTQRNSSSELIPGLGLGYDFSDALNVFAGVHRGFGPPGPGKSADVDPEESTNYEAGVRFAKGATAATAVVFLSDYDNLLGTDTASGGGSGSGDQFNGGEVRVQGLELQARHVFRRGAESASSFPVQFNYTFTDSEFRSNFTTGFADWAPEVFRGDELPYLPRHQFFVEVGWRKGRYSAFVAASYSDEMRTRSGQGSIPDDERIESRIVTDLSTRVRIRDRFHAFFHVRNLTDEIYVVARRPAGLRPGLPRTASAGFSYDF